MPLRKEMPGGGEYAAALLSPDSARELMVVVTGGAPAGPQPPGVEDEGTKCPGMTPECEGMFPASRFFRTSRAGEKPQFLALCKTAAEPQLLQAGGSRPLKSHPGNTCGREM